MNSKIRKDLESLLLDLSDKKIEKFKELIEENKIDSNTDVYKLKSELNLTGDEINLVKNVMNNFDSTTSIVIGLDLISEINQLKEEKRKSNSLVWTSPFVFNDKADSTKSSILELINSAKKSITIVGYTIEPDTGDVFEALENASKRGVQIRLLFDKAKKYLDIIENFWKTKGTFPKVYSYQAKNQRTSLHAKVLIIDSKELLITSANLTGRGITRNVEMGIRHKGESAKDAEELVDTLVANDYLVRIDG